MVTIAYNPDQYRLPSTGKSVDHIAWYDKDRGPVTTKQVMDIVTDDGSIYRWSRHRDGERWTFEHRVRPDGGRDSSRRTLPSTVDALVGRSPTVLYA